MSIRKVFMTLNVRKAESQTTVEGLHVGDVGSTQFVITLSDGTRTIDLTKYSVVSAIIHGKKPDGYEIHNNCTVLDGKIFYTLTAQDTAVSGTVYYQLDVQINDGSGEERCFSPCFRTQVSDRVYEPVFRLLTDVEAPENWAEHYADYYKKEDDIYVKNDDPTYAANTFYVLVDPPVESASEFLAFWAAYNNVTELFGKRLVIDSTTTDIGYDADNTHKVFINANVQGTKGIVLTAQSNRQYAVCSDGLLRTRAKASGDTYLDWEVKALKTEITSENKNSNSLIPSIKAVVDYITSAISGKADTVDVMAALAGKANLSDIPTVPTNVSAFTNDAGYITQHQDLSAYALAANVAASLALKADKENAVSYKEYAADISNISDNAIKDKQTIYRVYSNIYGWGLLFNVITDFAHAQIMLTHNGQILYREKGYNETWQNKSFTNVLSGYATTSALESGLAGKAAADHTHSQYLTEHQDISGKADKATTLAGYGISDAYTKVQTETAIDNNIINKLSFESNGKLIYTDDDIPYNLGDAKQCFYTKTESDGMLSNKADKSTTYTKSEVDEEFVNYEAYNHDIAELQDKAQKVTSITNYANDTQYPSAKAVKNFVEGKGYLTTHQDITGKENTSNKETAINSTTQSTDSTHYPTVGAVKDYISSNTEAQDEYNAQTYAEKSTTLAGYGITNAYTKAEVDAVIAAAIGGIENGSY